MKTKLSILLPAILLGLAACTQPKKGSLKAEAEIAKDTLTYQYKTFKQRAEDCGSKPDSGCTVIKITYPVFEAQPAFNDTVKNKLVGLFSVGDKTDNDFEPLAKNFMNAYKAGMKANSRKNMFYTLTNNASVVRQDSALTTLQLAGYNYMGGAHSASYTGFVNWGTKAHKNLALRDILIDGYEAQLNKIAEKIFRKQENLSDTSSLKNDYFFKNAKFSLNHNFLISPVGLRFVYNQYEIKPYAAGITDLLIPYTEIKTLLKPHTVVAQYVK